MLLSFISKMPKVKKTDGVVSYSIFVQGDFSHFGNVVPAIIELKVSSLIYDFNFVPNQVYDFDFIIEKPNFPLLCTSIQDVN